jgi:hypothetical protein
VCPLLINLSPHQFQAQAGLRRVLLVDAFEGEPHVDRNAVTWSHTTLVEQAEVDPPRQQVMQSPYGDHAARLSPGTGNDEGCGQWC